MKLSASTLARQKQIVAAALTFIDDVAAKRSFARSSLLAFTRRWRRWSCRTSHPPFTVAEIEAIARMVQLGQPLSDDELARLESQSPSFKANS